MPLRGEALQHAISVVLPVFFFLHSGDNRGGRSDAVAGSVPAGYFLTFLRARASVRTSARAHYGVALFGWDQHLFVSFLSAFRLRLWFAVSTTPGRHSEALTSCHCPLRGSCSSIQTGYSDQRMMRPRLSAALSLMRSRSSSSMRVSLFSTRELLSVSVRAPAGASTCKPSRSVVRMTPAPLRASRSSRAFIRRTAPAHRVLC